LELVALGIAEASKAHLMARRETSRVLRRPDFLEKIWIENILSPTSHTFSW